MTTEQAAARAEFDRLINMTAEEMTTHFASEESEYASLPVKVAAKLKQTSGKTLGKQALVLKQKTVWDDADFTKASECARAVKRFLGRKVAYQTAEGKNTPFAISLMNRGHNPLTALPVDPPPAALPTVAAAEAELTTEGISRKLSERIREMFLAMMGGEMPEDLPHPYIRWDGVYPVSQRAIFEWSGTLYVIDYAITADGSDVTVDPATMVEVTMEPVPVAAQDDVTPGVVTQVTEAAKGEGPKWFGVMIRAGKAKNKASNGQQRDYTAEALEAAVAAGKFDDVPGYDRTDAEHGARADADLAGTWGKATWDKVAKAVLNTFTWAESKISKAVNGAVKKAVAEGNADGVPGFSVVVDILVPKQQPHIVAEIEKVVSCDPVVSPSAGGVVLKVTESHINKEFKTMKATDALKALNITVPAKLVAEYDKHHVQEGAAADFMLAQLQAKKPKMFEKDTTLAAKLTKDEALLCTMFEALMEAEGVDTAPAPETPTDKTPAVAAEADAAAKLILTQAAEATARMNEFAVAGMLAQSGLNQAAQTLVRQRLEGKPFDAAKVSEAITDAKNLMQQIRSDLAPHLNISAGADQADKVGQAWNDMFFADVRDPKVREGVSESVTGRKDRQGRVIPGLSKHVGHEVMSVHRLCEMALGRQVNWGDRLEVQEAMDTVVAAAVLVNGMNLRVAYEFALESEYNDLFKVANVVNISDMKTKNVIASGSLSGWAAKDATTGFPTLTASGATKESYSPAEYGGIHSIEWINFVNDDTGYFQSIPKWIGQEALFGLNDFFWSTLVALNPALTDTVTVFAAARENYMTDALADDSLTTAIGKIQQVQHPGKTSGRPRMTRAKYLAVTSSVAQQKKAYELLTPAFGLQNPVAGFVQSRGMQVIINPIATDPNDWWLFGADPAGIVEIGIYGGQIAPLIVVANDPGVGRRFTHNEIQIKGEQDYGGNWVTPKNALWSHVAD